ncbi:DEAD/DEAH box helicase [Amycolatopsis sp. PS_44_ISF1]|uniref:DEAD/DEAH box helicase n=1 Tax=Amycolatopsis sp. PS_44_ISF1 TaxID=2974917 RepID=UPI0028DE863C|nr:DEAD/DEAH box helicase [Amycolatopsis sp. PS_44_ISF1]MDT8910051.1 DEAD/DEAH box helicase [Amycolatopsis sp. PS_44_ISF1]
MVEFVKAAGVSGERPARYAPGAQVRVRDEQWLVRKVGITSDGWMLEVTGVSPFVRGTDAVFYEDIEGAGQIEVLDPKRTRLVADDSPNHRRARLYLEAVLRKTALPQTEHGLALAGGFLMDFQTHQLRPAELALSLRNLRPRVLIADVVGLGKTLEIGILLAELIRRGRGERILVVSPAHVLEQFQRELWTRFALPLVRLDTTGIQRIQQDIPAGRNPFAYFKRVIISVDTLKGESYKQHLASTDWDVVVIDESHNLINRGTQNNDLARLLAARTDALILASATPHNGDARSFAELISLLDDAAIADLADYDPKDLEHLFIRRTKTAPEVRDGLRGEWADRGPSTPVPVSASVRERAVFAELAARWLPGDDAPAVAEPLIGYQLLKSFLSSHRALLATIATRMSTVEKAARETERRALVDLRMLAEAITDDDSAKLAALVAVLAELGVGPGSSTRVVVFSERIPTLRWLAETVPDKLGFRKTGKAEKVKPWLAYSGAVAVMHGDASTDDEQKRIVEAFGLRTDPVRLLFTGDIASEGVNLHQECAQLIHYDLPWSLIRIEQRNGRIDRYGQRIPPEFRALILTSDVKWRTDEHGTPLSLDDRLVGAKLLVREAEAHRIEGTAEAVTGLCRPRDEENRLVKDLIAGRSVERSLAASRQENGDFLASMLGNVGASPKIAEVATARVPTVFAATKDYFEEALRQICPTGPEDELALRRDADGTIAFEPPADLLHRLKALPKSYLDEQGILPGAGVPGRLRVTFNRGLAEKRLIAARETSGTQWPNVGYITDVHPVLDWVTDKALAAARHDEAFVLAFVPDPARAAAIDARLLADLAGPVFLVQGSYANALGRPTVVEWMAVTGLPERPRVVAMDAEFLAACGVSPAMPGRTAPDLASLQDLVPAAIDAARGCLAEREHEYAERVEAALAPAEARADRWEQLALDIANTAGSKARIDRTARRQEELVAAMKTEGAPMLRLLAVLDPLHVEGGHQ